MDTVWLALYNHFPPEIISLVLGRYRTVCGIPEMVYNEREGRVGQFGWTGKYTLGSVHTGRSRIWFRPPYTETVISDFQLQGETRDDVYLELLNGDSPPDCGLFNDSLDNVITTLSQRDIDHHFYVFIVGREWPEFRENTGSWFDDEGCDNIANLVDKWKVVVDSDWIILERYCGQAWLVHDIDAVIRELRMVRQHCLPQCQSFLS